MRHLRIVLWILVAVALLASAVLYWRQETRLAGVAPPATTQEVIRAAFTLTDHRGRMVSEKDFRGRWMLVFFGYTYCPDVCPTTLAEVASVMDRLGPLGAELAPLFITIDPARDSVAVLNDYVPAFHPSITGLTGSPAQIEDVAHNFRVYYKKVPAEDGSAPDHYDMDHSAFFYLIDPAGRFLEPLAGNLGVEALTDKLRGRLTGSS